VSGGYRVEPLTGQDRRAFSCGDPALDRYFRDFIGQDVRRRAATAFVAIEVEAGDVVGFYTLSAAEVDRAELPADAASKAPRYARIPAVLLGRLAVDVSHQRRRLGRALLADALKRAASSDVGIHLMLVQPKNGDARAFYVGCGFKALQSASGLMFLPITVGRGVG
jgi:GNAT superfamily N-acetyltransferase